MIKLLYSILLLASFALRSSDPDEQLKSSIARRCSPREVFLAIINYKLAATLDSACSPDQSTMAALDQVEFLCMSDESIAQRVAAVSQDERRAIIRERIDATERDVESCKRTPFWVYKYGMGVFLDAFDQAEPHIRPIPSMPGEIGQTFVVTAPTTNLEQKFFPQSDWVAKRREALAKIKVQLSN